MPATETSKSIRREPGVWEEIAQLIQTKIFPPESKDKFTMDEIEEKLRSEDTTLSSIDWRIVRRALWKLRWQGVLRPSYEVGAVRQKWSRAPKQTMMA